VPKILVEDNAPAQISQLNEEPYEVVSQGTATTVTSLGGFVEAGTILRVTPYVSRDNWLRLVYQVTLSSFGTRTAQQLAANLPPPRNVNESQGTVRVPSGHMVVLGGLTTTRSSELVDAVPFLADIPWFGELFKNRNKTDRQDTLFIFIRPVVLRDRRFRDLQLLSEQDIAAAGVEQSDSPVNPMKFLGGARDREVQEMQ
jgi:general secretion pathway protein D